MKPLLVIPRNPLEWCYDADVNRIDSALTMVLVSTGGAPRMSRARAVSERLSESVLSY